MHHYVETILFIFRVLLTLVHFMNQLTFVTSTMDSRNLLKLQCFNSLEPSYTLFCNKTEKLEALKISVKKSEFLYNLGSPHNHRLCNSLQEKALVSL